MTPLDAAFLLAEDEEPGVSLAIASIAVFEGPAPTRAQFSGMLAERIPQIPRYHQKVKKIPFDLGPPVWVDDENFDLDFHVRHTALAEPGGDAELAALMGQVMSERLNRDRPLWEYWFVEGLAGRRWAMISKVHHCMVDGVSGTDLYEVILDDSPHPRPAPPATWSARPAPSTMKLATTALSDLVLNPVRQLGRLATAVRHPGDFVGTVWQTARGLGALSSALRPATPSSLSGPVSAHRRFAWSRGRIADVRTVRHELGGTFNDVVLAAITGGFRTLLLTRGESPQAHTVRTLVPVNVREPGQESIRDNRVSLMLAYLPVDLAEPRERLAALRRHLDELKSTAEVESVANLTALAAQAPFPLVSAPFRLVAHLPQRSVVTVTTDVPGPRHPLYALGRRMVEVVPYVPIASTVRLGVSIYSYLDTITFGVTGDYDAAVDVDRLARSIAHSLEELASIAKSVPPG